MIGDLMTAGELKNKIVKKKYRDKLVVIGKLDAVVKDGSDHYYHIHNDEQIPYNVGVLLSVRRPNEH